MQASWTRWCHRRTLTSSVLVCQPKVHHAPPWPLRSVAPRRQLPSRCDDDGTLILFSYTYEFGADDAGVSPTVTPEVPVVPEVPEVPSPSPSSSSSSSQTAPGPFDQAGVKAATAQLKDQMSACYHRALVRAPTLAGRFEFEFDIDAATPGSTHGRVVDVRRKDTSTLASPEVEDCVRAALLASSVFPSPPGRTTVLQALVFAPTGP
jgi:hypothetical protein